MGETNNSAGRIHTGLYEIDVDSGEVLKEGRVIPLQEQPFSVLMVLLERPGRVVTREELRNRIWPDGTFVSFDEGLNTAIRKLRIMFGDSAENPRYIETIPRRGYRFIAPVSASAQQNGSNPKLNDLENARPPAQQPADTEIAPTSPSISPARQNWPRLAWLLLIAALAVAAVVFGITLLKRSQQSTSAEHTSAARVMLAVLPFRNMSNDPSEEYFSDGLTEETITDLGQLNPAQLGVIARASAMAYKQTDKTVAQIGRELGVDFILEGSVRRDNGRARITAQLIRVSDQTHLWAQSYDAQTSRDFLDVQNEIGRAIAEQVRTEITPQYKQAVADSRASNPEAQDLYLKGRFYWNQRTPASIAQSIDVFQRAIKAQPDFAQAYAAVADAYNIGNIIGLYSAKESLPKAKTAAMKAIELNPSLAEAHSALAMALSHYDFDLPAAKTEFLRALELDPNSAYAHLFFSNCYLLPVGKGSEAVVENRKAIQLDPLSLPINNFLGMSLLYAGDPTAAEKQFRSTIEMDQNFPLSHAYLSELLELTNRYPEAIDEAERADELSGASAERAAARAEMLRSAYKRRGAKGYWETRLVLDEQRMKASGRGISPVMMAMDSAMAGEKQKALQWLNKSYDEREGSELTLLAVDPVWNSLRGDPQFEELLRRIGLPSREVSAARTQ